MSENQKESVGLPCNFIPVKRKEVELVRDFQAASDQQAMKVGYAALRFFSEMGTFQQSRSALVMQLEALAEKYKLRDLDPDAHWELNKEARHFFKKE